MALSPKLRIPLGSFFSACRVPFPDPEEGRCVGRGIRKPPGEPESWHLQGPASGRSFLTSEEPPCSSPGLSVLIYKTRIAAPTTLIRLLRRQNEADDMLACWTVLGTWHTVEPI